VALFAHLHVNHDAPPDRYRLPIGRPIAVA
jgi:hypothetical protein